MSKSLTCALILKMAVLISLSSIIGCAEFNDPYSSSRSPYDDPYYGGTRNDDYYRNREWQRQREEQRRLDRERDRVEDERRRLEEERRRNEQYSKPSSPPPRQPDRCPPGFSPSEQKCSPQERKRGCKDMRTPSGLGCVRR